MLQRNLGLICMGPYLVISILERLFYKKPLYKQPSTGQPNI